MKLHNQTYIKLYNSEYDVDIIENEWLSFSALQLCYHTMREIFLIPNFRMSFHQYLSHIFHMSSIQHSSRRKSFYMSHVVRCLYVSESAIWVGLGWLCSLQLMNFSYFLELFSIAFTNYIEKSLPIIGHLLRTYI